MNQSAAVATSLPAVPVMMALATPVPGVAANEAADEADRTLAGTLADEADQTLIGP